MTPKTTAFLQDETDSAWLYGVLAELERDPKLAEVFRRLSETERGHAERWTRAGGGPARARPSRRVG